jgi:hypothetical protein
MIRARSSQPMGQTMARPLSRLQHHVREFRDPGLSVMLALQIFLMFVAGPLQEVGILDRWILNLSPILLGIMCLLVVSGDTTRYLTFSGLALSIAGLMLEAALPSGIAAAFAATVSGLVFSATICWAVRHAVFRGGRITPHRIRGAVLIYLNIAMVFALLDHLLYRLFPHAYLHVSPHHSLSQMLYFSVTTLTCSAYGDILPVHPLARSLASLEAVVGQLYLSTFIAALVGLQVSLRQRAALASRATTGLGESSAPR